MKKLYFLLLFIPIHALGHVYTSAANGDWYTTSTWSPTGTPGTNDTAVINNTVTVVSADPEAVCWRLVINSGGILNNAGTVGVERIAVNNTGGKWEGAGAVGIVGRAGTGDTVLSGGGDFSLQTGQWFFQSSSTTVVTMIIAPSIQFIKTTNFISLQTSIDHKPLKVLNLGYVKSSVIDYGGYATTWTQGTNAELYCYGASLTSSYDTLYASATGNIVVFGAGTYTIKNPKNSQFYKLIIDAGTLTMPNNLSVYLLELDVSTAHFNMNGYNMSLTGNWEDYGTITNNTGTITFDAVGSQCVIRPSGTEVFKNITIWRTSKLGSNCTVEATGTVVVQPGGSMDCTCP